MHPRKYGIWLLIHTFIRNKHYKQNCLELKIAVHIIIRITWYVFLACIHIAMRCKVSKISTKYPWILLFIQWIKGYWQFISLFFLVTLLLGLGLGRHRSFCTTGWRIVFACQTIIYFIKITSNVYMHQSPQGVNIDLKYHCYYCILKYIIPATIDVLRW